MIHAPQFADTTLEQLQAMRDRCAMRTGVLADPIMLNILDQEIASRRPAPIKTEIHHHYPAMLSGAVRDFVEMAAAGNTDADDLQRLACDLLGQNHPARTATATESSTGPIQAFNDRELWAH